MKRLLCASTILAWIILAFLMPSCAHIGTSTPPLPSPPPKAQPVAPVAVKVSEGVAATDKQAAAVVIAAKESTKAATAAREEAQRLAEKQEATPDELNGLWKALQTVEARNLFLEEETNRLTETINILRTSSAELGALSSAKDAENDELRRLNGFLTTTANHRAGEVSDLQQQLIDARKARDRLGGEIRLYRIALGVAALLLVLWIVLKLLLPPRLL